MCWLYQPAQLVAWPSFVLVALFLAGMLECLAGYRAWRFLIALNGAILGMFTGVMLWVMLPHPVIMVLGALAGGVAGAVLCVTLVELGTFMFALASGASLAALTVQALHLPDAAVLSAALMVGLVAGLLALAGGRPVVVVLTAICGAEQAVAAGMAWTAIHGYWTPPMMDVISPSEVAVLGFLASAGGWFQWVTTRGMDLAGKGRATDSGGAEALMPRGPADAAAHGSGLHGSH